MTNGTIVLGGARPTASTASPATTSLPTTIPTTYNPYIVVSNESALLEGGNVSSSSVAVAAVDVKTQPTTGPMSTTTKGIAFGVLETFDF